MNIYLHENDIPSDIKFSGAVAVDTETTGLHLKRDRLCLVQLSSGDGSAHLIRFTARNYKAPNLISILENSFFNKLDLINLLKYSTLRALMSRSCLST